MATLQRRQESKLMSTITAANTVTEVTQQAMSECDHMTYDVLISRQSPSMRSGVFCQNKHGGKVGCTNDCVPRNYYRYLASNENRR